MPAIGPRFDAPVPAGGYAWWYVDAISDDGRNALTIIGFVGSVFSPYYAWAGRQRPQNHCAINVALYGAGRSCWAMTERGQSAVSRAPDTLQIGPSAMHWDDGVLILRFDERGAPIPYAVRGEVRLTPRYRVGAPLRLDSAGRHLWWPLAPQADVEVTCSQPNLRWKGTGYLDTNAGIEPLETAFESWDWCRASFDDGAAVLYNVRPRGERERALALWIDGAGKVEEFIPPAHFDLKPSLWRVRRLTRGDDDAEPRVLRTLEDAPFYARSLIDTRIAGRPCTALHESLSLTRFASPIVKAMLPFRMPRIYWP